MNTENKPKIINPKLFSAPKSLKDDYIEKIYNLNNIIQDLNKKVNSKASKKLTLEPELSELQQNKCEKE